MSEYTATLTMEKTVTDYPEPHIIITEDGTVIVPEELQQIAVQFDKNVETVTFDCPRYHDGRDLFSMHIYIHYRRADGMVIPYLCENLILDTEDESIIHFDWTIDDVVTLVSGKISFLVCAKISNNKGVLEKRWSSRLNQEMVVLEGLDPGPIIVDEPTKDFIEQILLRMDTAAAVAFEKAAEAEEAAGRAERAAGNAEAAAEAAAENAVRAVEDSLNGIRDEKISDIRSAGVEEVNRIDEKANERLGDFDAVGAVRFDRQELSQTQKEQAKANVDAGGAIVCEASGETVAITDASDQPLRGLKIYGKSVQNGTPTPENPVEIESVGDGGSVLAVAGGNNHFAGLEYSWTTTNATEYKFSDNNNFTITYKGGTGSIQIHCMLDATIYRGKAITLSWGEWIQSNPAVIGRVFLQVYGANSTLLKNKFVNSKSGIKSLTIDVVPKEAVSIMLLFRIFQDDEGGAAPSVGNSAQFVNVQIGIGSEPKAYEPGNTPISATISTPGGLSGIPVSSGGNYTDASGQQWICDEMDFARGVYVRRVDPVNMVSLATPVETPISETDLTAYRTLHTNKPNTTVYTDSNAGLTVAYAADTKTYIDNKFAELAAAVLQNA